MSVIHKLFGRDLENEAELLVARRQLEWNRFIIKAQRILLSDRPDQTFAPKFDQTSGELKLRGQFILLPQNQRTLCSMLFRGTKPRIQPLEVMDVLDRFERPPSDKKFVLNTLRNLNQTLKASCGISDFFLYKQNQITLNKKYL